MKLKLNEAIKTTDTDRDRFVIKRSIFGLILSGETLIKSGSWFGNYLVRERLYQIQYEEFVDGWTYSFHWSNPIPKWRYVSHTIITN